MNAYIPILSAFVGAAIGSLLGAYFTFVSKKREKIWIEKFEILKQITEITGIIKEVYEIDHSGSMGIRTISDNEYNRLFEKMMSSKLKLREQSAALKLLVKEKKLKKFEVCLFNLNTNLQALFHIKPDENSTDFIEQVWAAAEELQKETIRLASKECL